MKTRRLPSWCIDIWLAAVLLLRIPLPRLPETAFAHGARAVWAYPLVGVITGGAAALTAAFAVWLGLPDAAAAGMALAVSCVLTGALHEDGLADTVDGFWGGQTPQRRLEIMKDSRVGTFGGLALGLVTGLRWVAMTTLVPTPMALVAVAVLSRAAMPLVMAMHPPARSSGLAHGVGRPGLPRALFGFGGALVIAAAACGASAVIPAILAGFTALAVGRIAHARIGGQTGDVLGAVQQIAEVGALLALCVTLT